MLEHSVYASENIVMAFAVEGKSFLITGGASGMGARYLKKFLDQGAKRIAILDIAEDQGKALVEQYNKTHPGQVTFIRCDMSKEEQIAKAFEEVVAKFKRVDVIINNAGIMVDAANMWRTATEVNYEGLVSLTLKGIKHMDKSEGGAGGTIVNIASTAALIRLPMLPIYCGAKSAVMHFSRSIGMEPFYDNTGVRVLCICFGPTDTPLLHNLDKRVYDPKLGAEFAEHTPDKGVLYQKVDSAISSVDHMLKNGTSGSVWLSVDDRPVKDITAVVLQAYDLFEKEITG